MLMAILGSDMNETGWDGFHNRMFTATGPADGQGQAVGIPGIAIWKFEWTRRVCVEQHPLDSTNQSCKSSQVYLPT